jgi:ribosomal protein S12 methylthiotransferase accessory factor
MIETPVIRPHLHVQTVLPDRVFLYGEGRQYALSGKAYVAVSELIDGKRSSNDIIESLIDTVSTTDSAYALLMLEKNRYIEEAPVSMPVEQAAFWSALDVPVRKAEEVLRTTPVSITVLGNHSTWGLCDALASLGIRVADSPDQAALNIVVADDYLRSDLERINREAIASERPWLLIQPNGLSPMVGPHFVPGTTGCWSCLEQRMRANREVETFLDGVAGRQNPLAARSTLPTTSQLVYTICATEVAKILVGANAMARNNVIRSIDPATVSIREHVLVRRPQCPACGDPEGEAIGQPAPIVLSNVKKTFITDGGHRASTPEESLERYKHHISPLTGVVKALVRTTDPADPYQHVYISGQNLAARYDSYQALRRNIRGSSCGKGTTDAQAQVSGLCEAVERYSGVFRGEEHRIQGSMHSIGDLAVDPRSSMLYSEQQYRDRDEWNGLKRNLDVVPVPFDPDATMDWTPVWSLTQSAIRYLPTSYLFYGHPTRPEEFYTPADSNGCAAGNTIEEAILQGFMELIERDSVALWWYNRARRPQLDLDSIDMPYLHSLRDIHRRQNRELWVLDITADFGIPALVALSRRTDKPVQDITFAPAAHFDPKIALLRALTELNQMMPGVTSIGQDGSGTYAYEDAEAQHWWRTATVENQPYLLPAEHLPMRRLDEFAVTWTDDLKDDIELCRSMVEAKGLEMLVLDQTRPDIGIPVTKVIIPGLRHFWARYAPGRLYDVPAELGWVDAPLTEQDLNPITIFI